MEWIKFEDKYLNKFLCFIKEELLYYFDKLSDLEKSYFYHFWLKILNEHKCFLLLKEDKASGFISKPEWEVKHWIRWPENYLILRDEEMGELSLPVEFKKERFFRTGSSQAGKVLKGKITQGAFVRNLQDFDIKTVVSINNEINCFELNEEADNRILSLLDREIRDADVEPGFYEDYYLPELVRNIKSNHKNRTGFCFYACMKNSDNPIAISFYDGFELPFTGAPCLLINDIVVKKEQRRKRVATTLQAYAYERLKKHNVRWVMGNIETGNTSSMKQAEALKRYEWTSVIDLGEKK